MKLIKLYELAGAALLYPAKTGFHFMNQVGGSACEQLSLEGMLIPFNNDYPLEQPEAFIENRLCSYFADHGWGKLTLDQVDELDNILDEYSETKGVKVDRERLDKSTEAWVWVICKETANSCFEGFGEFKAVLTWPNSD